MADADLGTRIRRARERKRWTQAQLASALGVAVRTVGSWERGEVVPRSSIGALEHVLEVDFSDGAEPDPNEAKLNSLDNLDAAQLARLVEAYRAIREGGSAPASPGRQRAG